MLTALRRIAPLAAGLALAGWAGGAQGAGIRIDPIQLHLPAEAPTALLSLHNDAAEPARLQLTVFAWDQDPEGKMLLTPTSDIAVFPPLLSVGPGEDRNIRFGALVAPGVLERSYRLQIDELPPLAPKGSAQPQINTRMRISLPIFVGATRPTIEVGIDKLAIAQGLVTFEVVNRGTTHVQPPSVHLEGRTAAGQTVYKNEQKSWYLLPRGKRVYSLRLAPVDCARLATLSVEVPLQGVPSVTRALPISQQACGR